MRDRRWQVDLGPNDTDTIGRIFCAAATGAGYALLSPCVRRYGYGAPQRRAWAAERPRPRMAALNELSAPVLTIDDIPHRGMSGKPVDLGRWLIYGGTDWPPWR
jgi:hypothetical protein